jgi:hypothetical protein
MAIILPEIGKSSTIMADPNDELCLWEMTTEIADERL